MWCMIRVLSVWKTWLDPVELSLIGTYRMLASNSAPAKYWPVSRHFDSGWIVMVCQIASDCILQSWRPLQTLDRPHIFTYTCCVTNFAKYSYNNEQRCVLVGLRLESGGIIPKWCAKSAVLLCHRVRILPSKVDIGSYERHAIEASSRVWQRQVFGTGQITGQIFGLIFDQILKMTFSASLISWHPGDTAEGRACLCCIDNSTDVTVRCDLCWYQVSSVPGKWTSATLYVQFSCSWCRRYLYNMIDDFIL